jgi:nucleotide-binding universal stress UspA family protein
MFAQAIRRHHFAEASSPAAMGPSAAWRDEVGNATELIASRARFFDLVVLGRSERVVDRPAGDVIEATLLRSGRPVLLAPASPPAAIGETIAVAWDGSPRAVHVLAAALPLLRKAKRTVLLTVGDNPDAGAAAARDYLLWHGIANDHSATPAVAGARIGEQLLSAARDAGADLLAMGAFGHRPWREALFGGATATIVANSLLPVLMTH